MIFKDKYNNSIYTMCEVNEDFGNLIMDYIMDLPTEVLKEVQNGKVFNASYDNDNYVAFAQDDALGVLLESCFFGKTVSLLVFPLVKEELDTIEVSDDNDDLVEMIDSSKELGQLQVVEKDSDKVQSYCLYLCRFSDGYEIILIKTLSPLEEEFDSYECDIDFYTTKEISKKRLLEIINTKKENIIR